MLYWFDIVWTVVLIAYVALAAAAITQIARSPKLGSLGKTGWILLVVLVPFIGVAAWFVFKPSKPRAVTS